MAFRVESQQNPIVQFLGGGLSHFAEAKAKRKQGAELQKLSALDPNASPLEKVQAIYGLDLDDDVKKDIFKTLNDIEGTKSKGAKNKRDEEAEQADYDIIKKYHGEEGADRWKAASVGGRTLLEKHWLEEEQRGNGPQPQEPQQARQMPAEQAGAVPAPSLAATAGGEAPKPKLVDFDKGLTPKERVARQEKRYTTNLPLFQELQDKSRATEGDSIALDNAAVLNDSGQLPSGAGRLNIDSEGNLRFAWAATPEAQLYEKIINDFTRRAKESYGARVTNFDLGQFMKRLPRLTNSEEGRRLILKHLSLINRMDTLYQNTLKGVIGEYGGVRNIDYDKAQQIAEKRISKQMGELTKEARQLDVGSAKAYNTEIDRMRTKVPQGYILVEDNNGVTGAIPKDKYEKNEGKYRKL